jgi:CRP-like cAMP-binding protein
MTPLSTLTLTRHFKPHRPLFCQGEPCKGTFVVMHGKVSLSTGNGLRQRIGLGFAREGSVIGLCETIGGSPYQTTAVADTNVTAHFIPTRDVLTLMSDDPSTGMQVVQMLVGDVTHLYSRIRRMAFGAHGVHTRFA